MKILFWIRPQTALMVILAVNVFVPALSAEVCEIRIERKSESSMIYKRVYDLLVDSGLDADVAKQKVSGLFSADTSKLDLRFQNLTSHPELGIEHESLIKVFSKRALYDRAINLEDYHTLTSLVHDIKGHALSDAQRHAILQVSALNQAV